MDSQWRRLPNRVESVALRQTGAEGEGGVRRAATDRRRVQRRNNPAENSIPRNQGGSVVSVR